MARIFEEIIKFQQRRAHGEYALGGDAAPDTVAELEEALNAAEREDMLNENLDERKGSPYEKRTGHETEAGYSKSERKGLLKAIEKGKTHMKPHQKISKGAKSYKKAHARSVRRSKKKEIEARLRGEEVSLPVESVFILSALSEVEGCTMSAPEIAETTGLEKSIVRNELAVMGQANLVARTHPSGDTWRLTHFGEACVSHRGKKRKNKKLAPKSDKPKRVEPAKVEELSEGKFKLKKVLDTHKVKDPKKQAQLFGAMLAERGYESEIVKHKGGWLTLADDGRGILFVKESIQKRGSLNEAKGSYQAQGPLEKMVGEMFHGQSGRWLTKEQMKAIVKVLNKRGITKPTKDSYDDIARIVGKTLSSVMK